MYLIETMDELTAVNGGTIKCTVSNTGVSCTGSAEEWGNVAFGAFDTLKGWGGSLGIAIYNWTH